MHSAKGHVQYGVKDVKHCRCVSSSFKFPSERIFSLIYKVAPTVPGVTTGSDLGVAGALIKGETCKPVNAGRVVYFSLEALCNWGGRKIASQNTLLSYDEGQEQGY